MAGENRDDIAHGGQQRGVIELQIERHFLPGASRPEQRHGGTEQLRPGPLREPEHRGHRSALGSRIIQNLRSRCEHALELIGRHQRDGHRPWCQRCSAVDQTLGHLPPGLEDDQLAGRHVCREGAVDRVSLPPYTMPRRVCRTGATGRAEAVQSLPSGTARPSTVRLDRAATARDTTGGVWKKVPSSPAGTSPRAAARARGTRSPSVRRPLLPGVPASSRR